MQSLLELLYGSKGVPRLHSSMISYSTCEKLYIILFEEREDAIWKAENQVAC